VSGKGKRAFLGFATESTYGTGAAATTFIQFTEGNLSAPRELIESNALAASRTILQATNAAQTPEGTFTSENDGVALGLPFFYWNGGSSGHSVSALGDLISTAPSMTPASGPNSASPLGFAVTTDDGATFTSYLTEVTGSGNAPLDSLSTAANGDYFYVGHSQKFDDVTLTMTANVNSNASTLAAQYWDGDEWQTMTITADGTVSGGATLAQTGTVELTRPSGWKMLALGSLPALYWVRFSVSAALSSSVEVDTAAVVFDAFGATGNAAAGDYTWRVAGVWKWDPYDDATEPKYVITPASSASSTATAASGGRVAISWTNPTGLTLPDDFTYYGTIVYRSDAGPTGTHEFAFFVLGTASSSVDYGQAKDAAVDAFTDSIYEHTFTLPAGSADLPGFSATYDQDVSFAKRAEGCRMDTFEYTIGGVNEITSIAFGLLALRAVKVAKPSGSVTVYEPIVGARAIAAIDGTGSCDIESLSISGENGLEHVFGLCGVAEARNIQDNDFRRISGQFTRQQVDLDFFEKVQNGTEFSLQVSSYGESINSTSDTNVTDHGIKADAFPFMTIFDVYRCRAGDADAPVPSGGGRIIETVTWSAFKDNTTGTDIQLRVFNTVSNYS